MGAYQYEDDELRSGPGIGGKYAMPVHGAPSVAEIEAAAKCKYNLAVARNPKRDQIADWKHANNEVKSVWRDDARAMLEAAARVSDGKMEGAVMTDLNRECVRLRRLLKEARQYVADAGCEEEPGEHQAKLLADIDAILV